MVWSTSYVCIFGVTYHAVFCTTVILLLLLSVELWCSLHNKQTQIHLRVKDLSRWYTVLYYVCCLCNFCSVPQPFRFRSGSEKGANFFSPTHTYQISGITSRSPPPVGCGTNGPTGATQTLWEMNSRRTESFLSKFKIATEAGAAASLRLHTYHTNNTLKDLLWAVKAVRSERAEEDGARLAYT